jgi:hypothetical protein
MAVPKDWVLSLHRVSGQLLPAGESRVICPHCGIACTFETKAIHIETRIGNSEVHLCLKCNHGACRKIVYIYTVVEKGKNDPRPDALFFTYPSRSVARRHPGVPTGTAEDWIEAQIAFHALAPKAAAVMCRRVLYSVLLDKGCKLKPLKEGLNELIQSQRLPAIFDEWLHAIKDDGHHGAHPDRSLTVSYENLAETMEYTSELIRFLYIEPHDFQIRKDRNTAKTVSKV